MGDQSIADGTLPVPAGQPGMSPIDFRAARAARLDAVFPPPAEPARIQIGPLDV